MRQTVGNISHTLLLSMALHVAVLGSALAFAHYGGHLERRTLPVIMVSLADGQGLGVKGGKVRIPAAEQTAPPQKADLSPGKDMPALHDDSTPQSVSAPVGEPGPIAGGNASAHGEGVTSAEGVGGGSTSAGSSGTDLSGQWQLLQGALERAKSYPRFARERGIEGTVLVRFRVLPTGDVESVNVVQSSGSEVLDTATVRTVYRAAPFPFVNGWVEVPISYLLKRE